MANTYTRVYLHVIIRVKRGHPRIKPTFEKELYGYIGAIIKNQGHFPVRINGVSNHIHILLIFKPVGDLSALMREVKSESSRMINEAGWTRRKFRWQVGFAAFSCDHHSVDVVVKYIEKQKEHHAKGRTFRAEYQEFLDMYGVDWNERYLED
ncbi:MAG: transposase [Candidatus Marinimicrobia bacterium]|nr:transposase [Candidatus Neomarinimicrobiota bacterium]MCF7903611.1 transposase [Candidatus Neomarinimicrobiota bacterium]